MTEKTLTLPSGSTLKIQAVSWEEACKLNKAVMKVVSEIPFAKDDMLNVMAKIIISDGIETALIPCLGRATYDGAKVTNDLFENNFKARKDYLLIQKEVLAFNMAPFLDGLGSVLSGLSLLKSIATPKSE